METKIPRAAPATRRTAAARLPLPGRRKCAGTPLSPEPQETVDEEPLVVTPVQEPIVVAAWAEPKELPPGGGQAQIIVRIQRRGGKRFPGVEVRLRSSTGALFSSGKVLVTDGSGMTRDRLTTKKTTTITLNAGGTRYRFQVPVTEASQ